MNKIIAISTRVVFVSLVAWSFAFSLAFPRAAYAQDQQRAALSAAVKNQTPKLSVPNAIFDFGEVPQGQKVQYSFALRNVGNGELEIRRVHPACGCTAAVAQDNLVAPGGQTTISGIFDTTGFQGYKVKTIRVYSNDPTQLSTVLTLKGTIRPDVFIDPPRIYFGEVAKGQAHSKSVVVKLDASRQLKISNVLSRSDNIDVKVEDVPGATNRVKRITVTLKDNLPVGVFRNRVVVRTTSSQNPVVNIPIFARVQGDLKLSPPDISFGLLEGPLKQAVSSSARLINSGTSPVSIVSVKSDSELISASIDKTGAEPEVHVSLGAGVSGSIKAQVSVMTNHPDPEQREIVLPIYGIISRKGG